MSALTGDFYRSLLALPRSEVSALVYGSRSFDGHGGYPAGGHQDGGLRTDTWFGNMLLGPELRLRSGAVRPYAHALAGPSPSAGGGQGGK